jgi:diguanylate cyclase (GGDEF)-like protein
MKKSIADPRFLIPAIAVVALLAIWGTAWNAIRSERSVAAHAAAASSRELSATYEAQVVRALREIDQTLKVVKYAYEERGSVAVVQELKGREMLPSDRLFDVSIANVDGDIVAGTRATGRANVADQYYFQSQRGTDVFSVGRPRQSADTGEWKLQFSRRLDGPRGAFAGIVMIAVDASFFVSGYETSKLGEQGVLAVLGTDGVFRVRRTGDVVSAGQSVDYLTVVSANDEAQGEAPLTVNVWDGVERYTATRQLYDFPLAVIVGLSREEQLAHASHNSYVQAGRALGGSVILIMIATVLARMNRQLTLAHRLAGEEQVAHAERVEYLAYHDSLTKLPNRGLFSRSLERAIQYAQEHDRQLAVLFLDLDHFKNINDTLGHEAGDQLLVEVAKRFRRCVRDGDTVARLGGDEFVAILPELQDERYAAIVASKVIAAVAKPFVLNGQDFLVTASIGISIFPRDGPNARTLKKNADTAMYKAKEEGKNGFQFFSEQLNDNSRERLAIEAGLRTAVERGELHLHYLAKRDMRTGRITGVEALLRWQNPELGNVAPLLFIPVAEETGLIVPIGKWVLRSACDQSVAWRKEGLPPMSMDVNLSRRQFTDAGLLVDLASILEQTGMAAQSLELEITESLLMRDVQHALGILTAVKDMGIRISIDNFGSGYSSLAALRQFPLDTIKIDRTFIRDVASDPQSKDLTAAIIAMARTLSHTIVAQGVETREQADFLRVNAIDEFQGFYLDQPVPAGEIAQSLRKQASDVASELGAAADA